MGWLLALQLLGAIAVQFSPDLHHEIHEHSHCEDHTCLVTLLQAGTIDLSVVATESMVICPSPASSTPPRLEHFPSLVAYRFLPGRAPPALV